MKKKDRLALALGMGLIILLTGCPGELELSGENSIVTFSFEAEDNPSLSASVTGTIEITEITRKSTGILVTVPYGTDLTALVAAFTAAYGASVTVDGVVQESGVTENDFTDPVTYTVTAEDGSIRYYTVTVVFDPDTVKEITAFSFTIAANPQLDNTVTGVITGTEIALTVPYSTDVTELVATYTMNGASVSAGGTEQESGVTANDFTDPVTHTVTAEDGSTQEYTVTVTAAPPSAEKEITRYSFPAADNAELYTDIAGIISGTEITVTVPFGTDVTVLTGAFVTSGYSVTVGGTAQESGVTANDFSDPVTYTVTAEDGSVRDYTVTVSISDAAEGPGFANADHPGDGGTFLLGDREVLITMVYAQNRESIAVPVGYTAEVPTNEPNSNYDDGVVILTVPFWIGETEVTNAAAAAVLQWAYDTGRLSNNVSDHNGFDGTTVKYGGQELFDLDAAECRVTSSKGFIVTSSDYDDHPVTNISWYGAVMLCNWLTEMRDGHSGNVVYTNIDTTWEDHETEADTAQNGYRLPSSDEWEYAARYRGLDTTNTVSGYSNPYFTQGDSASGATDDYTNSSACREVAIVFEPDEFEVKSLGITGANTLGLYDMSGNVWEWCFTPSDAGRIDRGGGYDAAAANDLRIGDWYEGSSLEGRDNLGFRLCRTAD